MKIELAAFQQKASDELRMASLAALEAYRRTAVPQIISFTAPTGSGKTIICTAFLEAVYRGDTMDADRQDTIVLWLSDSPELNVQSKDKLELKSDLFRVGQCTVISDEGFDSEMFDDGGIYFLNTQKLGRASNLVRHGDTRQYTIWETLANTVREKSDRFYVIIDEAHRGAQGNEAGRATTIMQKFIKGSPGDGLPPMPLVIGMSATSARFQKLAGNTTSTVQKVTVAPESVRESGLLKDRIIINYTDEQNESSAYSVLQAAAENWLDKWNRWDQYCTEQHYKHVCPVFVVQVLKGTGGRFTDTDLDACIKTIETVTGYRFREGEIVHTFGERADVTANGLKIPYENPSRIQDNRTIKVVLFKEALSTGWDCPRAETMMSYRKAVDATYIAQLLGRMIRTPLHMRVHVDQTLNDVSLFLPYFNRGTVDSIVEELRSPECGDVPTETVDVNEGSLVTVSVGGHRRRNRQPIPGEQNVFTETTTPNRSEQPSGTDNPSTEQTASGQTSPDGTPTSDNVDTPTSGTSGSDITTQSGSQTGIRGIRTISEHTAPGSTRQGERTRELDPGDEVREAVLKDFNMREYLTYDIRRAQTRDSVTSMYALARLISRCGFDVDAAKKVDAWVIGLIRAYIDGLKRDGVYEESVRKIAEIKLFKKSYDTYGIFSEDSDANRDNGEQRSLFGGVLINEDVLDSQLRSAEAKLHGLGIANAYGRAYNETDDVQAWKKHVILYAASEEQMLRLEEFAKRKFHELDDEYRRRFAMRNDESTLSEYNGIVSNESPISKHIFLIPQTLTMRVGSARNNTRNYEAHLLTNADGLFPANLNDWEENLLKEEMQRDDFVCWLRNFRSSWGLCIPYEMNGETKALYPDFIIFRRDGTEYVADILEPHGPQLADNVAKAKGLARYAERCSKWGRIQMIRMTSEIGGRHVFRRLDFTKCDVREAVLWPNLTDDDLNAIFNRYGV